MYSVVKNKIWGKNKLVLLKKKWIIRIKLLYILENFQVDLSFFIINFTFLL